jgi:uncharacterized Zn-binding protein involved in type VI secretion
MAFPAARLYVDFHACPGSELVKPAVHNCIKPDEPAVSLSHIGGVIVGEGSKNVRVNSLPAARAGDKAICTGVAQMDLIVTGASNVLINGRLAAVLGSRTFHGGTVTGPCSGNVNMGSKMAGASFGDPANGTEACRKAAKMRKKYKESVSGVPIPEEQRDCSQASEMNCGQESVRQLCIQKCLQNPSSAKACQAESTSEGDWYKKYMYEEKDAHNQANKDANEQIRQRNDQKWNGQVLAATSVSTSKTSGSEFDPKSSSWQEHQGQTLYLWPTAKVSVVNSPTTVYIEPLDSEVTNPDEDAKNGRVGSYPETQADMLKNSCGVNATLGENSTQSIAGDLANGKTVIAGVDSDKINGGDPSDKAHAVTVTGMQFDDKGNLVKVTVNDTGNPNGANVCGREFTGPGLQDFKDALYRERGRQTVVA